MEERRLIMDYNLQSCGIITKSSGQADNSAYAQNTLKSVTHTFSDFDFDVISYIQQNHAGEIGRISFYFDIVPVEEEVDHLYVSTSTAEKDGFLIGLTDTPGIYVTKSNTNFSYVFDFSNMNRSLLVDGVQKESSTVPGRLRNASGYLTVLNPTSMWFMSPVSSGDYAKFPFGKCITSYNY